MYTFILLDTLKVKHYCNRELDKVYFVFNVYKEHNISYVNIIRCIFIIQAQKMVIKTFLSTI